MLIADLLAFVEMEAQVSQMRLAGNATYQSWTARDDMRKAMYDVVQEQTKSAIAKALFCSIMSDESTDVSNVSQLLVHLRCVREGTITTRIGGLAALGARDALSIKAALDEKFAGLGVDWKKCHLSSDGANVFPGKHN